MMLLLCRITNIGVVKAVFGGFSHYVKNERKTTFQNMAFLIEISIFQYLKIRHGLLIKGMSYNM